MAAKDTGPLDWRTPIVDAQGRPSPEFQRRWNTQRNNNALIGTVTFGSGAPPASPAPAAGAFYLDISATPSVLYIGHGGAWVKASLRDFVELVDVPNSYTGAAGNLVQVNAVAAGLQFAALSAILDSLGATQGDILYRDAAAWKALAPGTAGQVLSTGAAGANPSWITPAGGGGALALISEVVTAGSQASVTFSAIPATYRDLEIHIRGRGTAAATSAAVQLQFNGDVANHYTIANLFSGATGSTASIAQASTSSSLQIGILPAATATASYAGVMRAVIGDYRGTNFFKSTISDYNGYYGAAVNQIMGLFGGSWSSTAAINSILVFLNSGSFVNGTVVSLYGRF